jgi:hypothetical protein
LDSDNQVSVVRRHDGAQRDRMRFVAPEGESVALQRSRRIEGECPMKMFQQKKALVATLALLMFGLSSDLAPAVQASSGGAGSDGPVTPVDCTASSAWYSCNISKIEENERVITVFCDGEAGKKRLSAVAKNDANLADRFLSVATAAILSGRNMRILQDTSTGSDCTNPPGCSTSNCSRAVGFGLGK